LAIDARCVPCFSTDLPDDPQLSRLAKAAGFTAEVESTLLVGEGEVPTLLVGCGERTHLTERSLRIAFAAAGRTLSHLGQVEVGLASITSDVLPAEVRDRAAVEGLLLGSYRFDKHQTLRPPAPPVEWVPATRSPGWELGTQVAGAIVDVRDLVNEPANIVTPSALADHMAKLGERVGLAVTVRDEQWLTGAGAGGILAIGRGSQERPVLVELVHEGDGGEVDLCLVGKGVTFDSGGLSIKGPEALIGMQSDMAAAAVIAHSMALLPTVAPTLNVRAFCPLVENMPGPYATRPGDIVTARNGMTIEILDTDYEGRVILADGLAFAAEHHPRHLVDLATLTYGAPKALGPRTAALFGHGPAVELVDKAARTSGEPVWPLPMLEYLMPTIRSRVADVKNFPAEEKGRASTAAMFLREFVPAGGSWVHLDIAGPSWADQIYELAGLGATGYGVRLLLELFALLEAERSGTATGTP
jgi:leucyl aminopeptidase